MLEIPAARTATMTFLVIPALDLKGGKCVRLIGGDPSKETIKLDNPVEIAKKWESLGAKRLHLVDLDGAIEGVRKNESLVKNIIEVLQVPVQFGGGMRTLEDARFFLDLGAEKVILGTIAVKKPEIVKSLAEKYGGDRIVVALDSKKGKVVVKGWTESTNLNAIDLIKKFESSAGEVLFTDVDVEGKIEGINEAVFKEVIDSTSLGIIASGGISSIADIKKLKKLGASGVVIGSALYTGKIDFTKAKKVED